MVKPRRIADFKPTFTNLAQTSHYQVMFGGVPLGVRQYLNIRGVDYRFVTETSGLLCSNAVIPGSTLADTKVIGNYQGVIENMTHARIFPDIALEFYVDKDYKLIKFFEHYIEFVSGGSGYDQTREDYYFKMEYPYDYKMYGAKIIDAPDDDFAGAIAMRDAYLAGNPNTWSPLQFSNRRNVECHFTSTAPEIHKQVISLKRPWSAFIHGSGTGGTIEGVRRYLNYQNLATKVCMVKPVESPHGIQGIADGKEFLAKEKDMHEILEVKTQESIDRAVRLSTEMGLLVGISSGANVLAAERWIAENNPVGNVVTMLCDRGERYMSIYDKN